MKSLRNAFILIVIIWLVFIINFKFELCLSRFGILPRTKTGLIGIPVAPFLHADPYHLVSNSVALFILSFVLWSFYPKIALKIIFLSIIAGGSLVWLFARQSIHIGASGLIYSLTGFIVSMGFFHKSFRSLLIAIFIGFLYGGLIWGVFPTNSRISWEGHLFGGLIGIILAYFYRNTKIR